MKRMVVTILISVASVVVVSAIVAYAVVAIKMHSMLNCRCTGEPYDSANYGVESNVVNLTSVDGLALTAYEVRVERPSGVVICLGGIHSPTVTKWYGHSRLFADNGYSSLLLDLRSHGASEGKGIYAGTREWMDVDAAVEYIKSQECYRGVPIVVMGLSMGAATAVVSVGKNSNIDALISLSSYCDWAFNFDRNVEHKVSAVVARVLSPFVKIVTKLRFGKRVDITPERIIANLGNRPALLVHSVGDRLVPFASFERLTAVAPQAEQWVLNGDNHCIIEQFDTPQQDAEYCHKIIDFLDRNLKNE